ncbi:MAG: LysM peptidoglycan-binding domain-containing protein [Planctomycetota bacterium]|jgi:LysM repeat protein|nr:LysM peptidoglycan-binding domain-containing protein [Planctomycetota bacterium]
MDNFFDRDPEIATAGRRPRSRAPRFGPFVTIAAALLLLFGAASRVGKAPEIPALMGIDQLAEKRVRPDPSLIDAMVMIGGVPVEKEAVVPRRNALPTDSLPVPPPRGDLGLEERLSDNALGLRPPPGLSMNFDAADAMPENRENAPPAPTRPEPVSAKSHTYRVSQGDTWAKIAKRTLGDVNRWQEIRALNPGAANGLMVGMELILP